MRKTLETIRVCAYEIKKKEHHTKNLFFFYSYRNMQNQSRCCLHDLLLILEKKKGGDCCETLVEVRRYCEDHRGPDCDDHRGPEDYRKRSSRKAYPKGHRGPSSPTYVNPCHQYGFNSLECRCSFFDGIGRKDCPKSLCKHYANKELGLGWCVPKLGVERPKGTEKKESRFKTNKQNKQTQGNWAFWNEYNEE